MAPTIKFLCLIPGIKESYPVKSSEYFRPKWLDDSAQEYSKIRQSYKLNPWEIAENGTHVAKCVGIRKLFTNGWVVTTWQDILIDYNKETNELNWKTPINQANLHPQLGPAVSFHNPETFKHCPHLSQHKQIIKIVSPWIAVIPEGYSVMQQGMPYQEHDFFESAIGIFPADMGYMQINSQLLWKANGQTLIPAGTPLAYLTLIKNEDIKSEIRNMTQEEERIFAGQKNILDSSFERNYTEMRKSMCKSMGRLNE